MNNTVRNSSLLERDITVRSRDTMEKVLLQLQIISHRIQITIASRMARFEYVLGATTSG
jgi:hypothetical protein